MRLEAGSADQRGKTDFGYAEKILGGCGAVVALSSGSHPRGDRERLRKVVVRSGMRKDAGERKLQWELGSGSCGKTWVLGW